MAEYRFDCHACTNVYTDGSGAIWCKPMIDGLTACHIASGTCGKNFVFECDYFTIEPRQLELYPKKWSN